MWLLNLKPTIECYQFHYINHVEELSVLTTCCGDLIQIISKIFGVVIPVTSCDQNCNEALQFVYVTDFSMPMG